MYNRTLHFHFCGIAGSGMSGLAEILVAQGFTVSGSDLSGGSVSQRLQSLGITIYQGHNATNVAPGCSALVFSSAISPENPEIIRARDMGIPVIRRAEVLAELMRLKYGIAVAGSHGKTTTTSMLAVILDRAQFDPTVVVGGVVKGSASGGRLGRGDFLVAESDESDRSFLLLRPTIAVVTNIDSEHLSAYASLQELELCFEQFLQSVPFYGFAVVCMDDPVLSKMRASLRSKVIGYGRSQSADLRLSNVQHSNGSSSFLVTQKGVELGEITLPMAGEHFALNAVAAIAVALELSVPFSTIQAALASFTGVGRRIECIGSEQGVTIIDDYGHHPTEIRHTVQAVRDNWCRSGKRLHVVFQPHRYTRTEQCFADFVEVLSDLESLILLPIYSAGEPPVDGVSSDALLVAVQDMTLRNAKNFEVAVHRELCDDVSSASRQLVSLVEEGDCVLCLGAGSISSLAVEFKLHLAKRANEAIPRSTVVEQAALFA